MNFEKTENSFSYFFEAGSDQWNLDTPNKNDLYAAELNSLKGLATSFTRMQEDFVKEEKRRMEEASINPDQNIVSNMHGALGEMGELLRTLWA